MHTCPTCQQTTPEGNYCVRCGAPLDRELDRSRQRPQYAAAPGESRNAPWLVSTLFPHLPRHSERHFHIAIAGGAAIVIVLGALRLFPVALITAALLMPLLTVLYFYDVDIYEREPWWAAAWTLVWGAIAGVGVGLLAKSVAPTGPALIDRGSTAHVVTGGVLLPALGVLLMLAGPLVLLGNERFNDALDGATFGSITAATFAAAEAVVVGARVLSGGVRPAGAALPWVERLVALAIATPVLSMSAIGAACAALWLRYRAPVKDRTALGALGSPPVATAVAAALVITGAVGETFLPAGAWLAWLVALDLVALVLLRRTIHVGLLEEEAEAEIGPEVRCVNCGALTARHTFCGNCGISRRALPKAREAGARGSFAGRLAPEAAHRSGRRRLLAYAVALGAVAGVAVAVAATAAPPAPKPQCKPGIPCGAPPLVPHLATLPGYSPWQSTGLGFSLRYRKQDWSVASQGADNVALQSVDGNGVLLVAGTHGSQLSPSQAINAQLGSLQGQLLGLARDPSPSDQLLGTNVGLVPGPGGVYTATVTSPQGPETPVAIAVISATRRGVTIVATAVAPADDPNARAAIYQEADDMINSIRWG
jgi:RsiW-degrading membrane proteinase PrsW (M82 family)